MTRSKVIVICFMLILLCLSGLIIYRETKYRPSEEGEANKNIHLLGPLLDYYYTNFEMSKYAERKSYKFDREGVPIYFLKQNSYYHPTYISQFALGAYDHYLRTGDEVAFDDFQKSAKWLRSNLRKHGSFYFWEYGFKNETFPGGDGRLPWFSAMAQGQGVSVMMRAYVRTGDGAYLRACEIALEPIFHDLSQDGLSVVRGREYLFPQEYPSKPESDILNGAIFAYFGVYDYIRVERNERVEQYAATILRTLERELSSYDTGYWSLYARWPKNCLAPRHYNEVHIAQLKMLHLISGRNKFLIYSRKFAEYQDRWHDRLSYTLRNHLRQLREFQADDVYKIPAFVYGTLAE